MKRGYPGIEERCFGKSRDMLLKIGPGETIEPLLDLSDVIKELKAIQEQNETIIGLLKSIDSSVW